MTSRKERHRQRRQTERLLEEAHQALCSGERALAEKLVARAVDRGPMNPMVWYEAAQVLLGLEKPDEAGQALEQALRIAPGFELALEAMAALGRGDSRRAGPPALDLPESGPVAFTARTERHDWPELEAELAARGCAHLTGLLSPDECASLRGLDGFGDAFLGIGRRDDASGRFTWRYFSSPPPVLLAQLEAELFARLAQIADRWQALLGREQRFRTGLAALHERCASAGQILPGTRRIECDHGGFVGSARELPGPVVFPLQALIAISPAGGGARFMLMDDRPGRRKRSVELALEIGDAALFVTKERQVVVGGALGLQPIGWGLTPCTADSAAWIVVPFHLLA